MKCTGAAVFVLFFLSLVLSSYGKLSAPVGAEEPASAKVEEPDRTSETSERQTTSYKPILWKLSIDCNHKKFKYISTYDKIGVYIFDNYDKVIGEGYFDGCHYKAKTSIEAYGQAAKISLYAKGNDAVFIDSLTAKAPSIYFKKRFKEINVCLSMDDYDDEAEGWKVVNGCFDIVSYVF